MCHGTNLLKHTAHGHPHLRQFQLSTDHQRLLWYSAGPDRKESVMALSDVCELRLGQQTSTFLQYDTWLTGLKALLCAQCNRTNIVAATQLGVLMEDSGTISKEQLLAHSRRFREALKQDKAGVKVSV
ncbi:hypothetical protein Pmar_PMAR020274 [Perkinsus marinus ATCC 50983]|uniref:Uncharacterized protein n=1 Tax=Perkinsus marinus (strain ATCC 50983 / TXsc) TaxID=423536 RepID=C5LU18_PERM5|nr:hypothetical protein Pmar_PMAR020274 [Perkinsus marinus ATCC 50983]EEQ99816.1 hypothetical protein Pmar_PMAR020274 [Perkinsus marinus ATCC 50983]|eukprot:XP_002767099.1 hypothetical protein Pmar_PMAR020274 [Perkinsus marinus ATCC 50983]